MSFDYTRVFVVLNDKGIIEGIYKNKGNAIDSLPDEKRDAPMETGKLGVWSYGENNKWTVEQRKVKDSHDV